MILEGAPNGTSVRRPLDRLFGDALLVRVG
jgi:hypothetical protein